MASFSVPCPKTVPLVVASSQPTEKRHRIVSFRRSDSRSNPALATVSHSQGDDGRTTVISNNSSCGGCGLAHSDVFKVRAQLNEVAVEKIENATTSIETALSEKSESEYEVPDASSVSTFMTQVADLVKLVDSRDIVELQLKQMGCELLIRKKEALPLPSVPAPVLFTPPPRQQAMPPPQLPPTNATAPSGASAPSSSALLSARVAPAKPKSSTPPFKCPMAGNFYHSSAPGAPPFVKAGDKVQKGQVLCIIEAMKLMNEIEADQSGTVIEILVDDGKPVSVDTPLFIIEP